MVRRETGKTKREVQDTKESGSYRRRLKERQKKLEKNMRNNGNLKQLW